MKRFRTTLLFAFVSACFTLSVQAQQPQSAPAQQVSAIKTDASNSTMTVRREYLLGPNDVVELRVFGEPQFDGMFAVDSDGNLVVPFVEQPISAQCRNVKAVQKNVERALAKFLKNPRVYMSVKEEKSRIPATVYGAVRSPAQYEMRRPARLLELISKSHGVTEQQSGTIQIFHTQPLLCPEPEEMQVAAQVERGEDALGVPFTIYKVEDLKLGKSEANPYIHPGDVIYVAEAAPIYITGSVVQPSSLYLRDNMKLTRALAIVGGPKNAKETHVRIYRQKPGATKPETLTVDYKAIKQGKKEDFALQPYDIIEVPEEGKFSPAGIAKLLTGFATGGAGSLIAQAPLRILY